MPPTQTSFPMTIQRTELFVPLTTAMPAGESREFRIQVIPQAAEGKFTALEEDPGRRQAASDVIRATPAVQGSALGGQGGNIKHFPGKKNCEPQVLLQRDGDRVTNIRIQCSCGQVMDLACDYGAAKPAA